MRRMVIAAAGGLVLAGTAWGQVQWRELSPAAETFQLHEAGYRSDVIDIPLQPGADLEYKLGVAQGDAIVYQWQAMGLRDPQQLYAEFHGHTEPVDGTGDLMFYRKATGASEQGTLVAPFSGIHGWYLRNDSDGPVVVRLTVAGFYELVEPGVPAGQVGRINPAGLSTPPPGTYSHVARAGNLVFIAGQVGADAAGRLAGPDMQAQMVQALENLRTALASQGATFADVTKLTTYVTSIDEYRAPRMAQLRADIFGAMAPPNTLLQVSRLADPAFRIEIEATAVLP